MSSLSNTVKTTRKFIFAAIAFAIIVLVIQAISDNVINNNPPIGGGDERFYRPATAIPSAYSRFEMPSLTLLNQEPSEFVKVGDFPKFPPVVNVYKIEEPQIRLSSLQEAEEIAEQFEMDALYTKLNEFTYVWKKAGTSYEMIFDTRNEKLTVSSDLLTATSEPIVKREDREYIQNAISITGLLKLHEPQKIDVVGRVDYINIDAEGKIVSAETVDEASLVRVSLFKLMESSTVLSQYETSVDPNVPKTIDSQVFRPNIIDGFVTVFFKGEAATTEDVVLFNYLDYIYPEGAETDPNALAFVADIYPAIDLGEAFEKLKSKEPGTSLIILRKEDSNLFADYEPLNVLKFSVDAAKTKTIFIEPPSWEHLNPDGPWDGHIYPFYWFEGKATLDNGDITDFVFLVDTIAR